MNELKSVYQEILRDFDDLNNLELLLMKIDNKKDSITVLDEINHIYRKINDINELYTRISQDLDQTKNDKIEYVLETNSFIEPDNIMGENEKKIIEIYVKTIVSEKRMNLSQARSVKEIADLCPELNGNVVFRARSLYQQWESKDFDYIECDNSDDHSIKNRISSKNNSLISVYPNPVDDFLQISLSVISTRCVLKILDISGNLVLLEDLQEGYNKKSINVSEWKSGLYFIVVLNDGIMEEAVKLSIIH